MCERESEPSAAPTSASGAIAVARWFLLAHVSRDLVAGAFRAPFLE